VQGDGGFACLVSKGAGCLLIDQQMESNGAYWDLFKIDYDGKPRDQLREECRDLRSYGFELAVESQMRFSRMNEKLLKKHNLAYQDIRHVILQNISRRAYAVYGDLVQGTISPVCAQNLAQYGHLGCADVFLNLRLGLESGLFRTGERVLIMNNSPAAVWTSFLIQI
jgi:3-oxoacyl-[acyl-carrier-protein] synthase-3